MLFSVLQDMYFSLKSLHIQSNIGRSVGFVSAFRGTHMKRGIQGSSARKFLTFW